MSLETNKTERGIDLIDNPNEDLSDSQKKITANFQKISDDLDNAVVKNEDIQGGTKAKITYDNKGLVTKGEDLTESDIPTLQPTKVNGLPEALNSKAVKSNVINTPTSVLEDEVLITTDLDVNDELVVDGEVFCEGTDEETANQQEFAVQAGEYKEFAMANPKGRWLFCDGRELDFSDPKFKDLFNAIGFTYGGSLALGYFNIPDRRGLFGRTIDAGANRDMHPHRKLGSIQKDYVKQHSHFLGHWRPIFYAQTSRYGLYLGGSDSEITTTEGYDEAYRDKMNSKYDKLQKENTVKNISVFTCIRY